MEKHMKGVVAAICIARAAGEPMIEVPQVEALAGLGLKGDRYCTGEGSFNKGSPGKGQVTLINGIFFLGTGFTYTDSRRNIVTMDVELMRLIGREFAIGEIRMRGLKYCEPCNRPSKLAGQARSFMQMFWDRGGITAEILTGGIIKVDDVIFPPPKGY
jgi:hypothetical protein